MTSRLAVLVAAFTLAGASFAVAQGTKPAPKTARPPAKTAPATRKPPAAPSIAAPAPLPAPPSDVRYAAKYTAGDQVTESTSFFTSNRERYELGDIVLIRQRDQQRNVQISRAANIYVIVPDDAPAAAVRAAPKPPGVVMVTTSIVDLGEHKDMFGHTARHVRTLIERQPEPGACDQTKLRSDTDGWYIDMPKAIAAAPDPVKVPGTPSGCTDEIKTGETGDQKLLGFPISYRTTLTDLGDEDVKPSEAAMEITEFEVLRLDNALFDIPPGLAAAADAGAFTRAVSDANEARLASGGADASVPAKKAGTLRVGVPEVVNQTAQTVDTRALRTRIINELEAQKIDAIALAAAPPAALDARAKELDIDYLVVAEITELKTSKPGGFTKVMKATAREEARDITEAKLTMQLVAPGGGKPRLSKNSSGKDGGVGLKTGLKVAKFAGSVYLKFYMGGMLMGQMSALSSLQQMNLGGVGSMGSMMPMGYGGSVDRTAGAASFVMQNVMQGAAMGAAAQGGPSFDAALENAIEDGGKDVIEGIKKAAVRK